MPKLLAITVAAVIAVGCAGSGTANSATGAVRSSTNADWTRFGFDAQRSNDDPGSTGITAANVGSLTRHQVQLPGTVDSSAIYLHGVTVKGGTHDTLFVTTTYGITLAIDAHSRAILWQWQPPDYASFKGTAQITTATPVADPGRKWIYAASPDGEIQKLSVATGQPTWRVSITKDATHEKIASSLNYAGGHVIATTGGYIGDQPSYQGHVAIISPSGSLLHVWNSLCSNRSGLITPSSCASSDSAIWGRAGAVVMPGSGNLLVATGNGPWNGTTNWGDATIELSPTAHLVGNYTPTNTAELNATDQDIGSTSPVYLTKTLIAQGGKDGKIRLLSLARLKGTSAHKGHEVQIVSTPSGSQLFTAPAVWRANGKTWLIAADNGATQAWMLRNGHLHSVWRKSSTGGTSPVIAGGLLYVYNPSGGLNVYKPATGTLVKKLTAGHGHWNSPIVTGGFVALPEGNANNHATTGVLDIWR
ncbi:MAG TPA: PQQ-binding-like beta-propeller repeat protein [Gaiellaceae bacterium]